MLKKQVSEAFDKQVFLLGADAEGVYYWLEAPRWECEWYWGFGYIETYTNNQNPAKSRDINSHSHATNFLSEYFTTWNGSKPILTERTFDAKEGWEICELFEQFYLLRKTAEYYGRGKCHVAGTEIPLDQKPDLVKEINKIRIPVITARVCDILTPRPWELYRDKELLFKAKTEGECLARLHDLCPASWEHALKHEGYSIVNRG